MERSLLALEKVLLAFILICLISSRQCFQFSRNRAEVCALPIFTNLKLKSSELKRTPLVAASIALRPFDIRFQGVLERIKFHEQLLKYELFLFNFKTLRTNSTIPQAPIPPPNYMQTDDKFDQIQHALYESTKGRR
jgi:hypothetical protein